MKKGLINASLMLVASARSSDRFDSDEPMLTKDERWKDKSPAIFEPFNTAYQSAMMTLFEV